MKILYFILASLSFLEAGNYPFPTHIGPAGYQDGVIIPTNVSRPVMDTTIQSYYADWKTKYVRSPPGVLDQSYVFYNLAGTSSPSNAVSCSEGHGYGMLLAAYLDDQILFDNLFRYYEAYPSVIASALMGWQQILKNGVILPAPAGGNKSATDGDMDIAFALLLADKQWGSSGAIDYLTLARELMSAISAADVDHEVPVLVLGDWVEDDDEEYAKATRPSDFMLNHLRNFASASLDTSWNPLMTKTYAIINQLFTNNSPLTGLLPDFSENKNGVYVPAKPGFLERPVDGDYSWNACRTPWRIATDYILAGDDRALNQLTTLNRWIREKTDEDAELIVAGYRLDGTPLVDYGNLAFYSGFGVSAMINNENQEWLNKLWDTIIDQDRNVNGYFGTTVSLLCLIMISGNWWTPLNLPP